MIIGLVGVGTALIIGGLAFFGALTYSVNRTLDNEALASADEVAVMVETRLPLSLSPEAEAVALPEYECSWARGMGLLGE